MLTNPSNLALFSRRDRVGSSFGFPDRILLKKLCPPFVLVSEFTFLLDMSVGRCSHNEVATWFTKPFDFEFRLECLALIATPNESGERYDFILAPFLRVDPWISK